MIQFAVNCFTWIFSQDIFTLVVGSGMLLTFIVDLIHFIKAVR